MAWQDVLPLSVTRIDAEQERERRLAAQARAGAEWALAALVARYQPPVTRYLTRLTGDADLARTLAERIFLRMERRLRGPQGGHQLRLWLLRACTEAGLDAVRRPHRVSPAQLESPRFAGLLMGHTGDGTANRLRAGWEALAEMTGTTRRQVRKLIWNSPPAATEAAAWTQALAAELSGEGEPATGQDPREALRYRLIRAVLAELPYGDAQCLALHLVASLNQAEVAQALGITQSATRRRIVHGLQIFAQRYEAAAASLGLPLETLVGQRTDLIEQAQESAEVEATVATELALAPSPATPGQPTPIWSGAYAGPGEDVGLGTPPAELFVAPLPSEQSASVAAEEPLTPVMPVTPVMAPVSPLVVESVTEGNPVTPETIVDAAPFAVMPACEDRIVIVALESPPDAMEVALEVERVPLIVEAALSVSSGDMGMYTARLVPVLTPGMDAAHDSIADALAVQTPAVDSGNIAALTSDTASAGAPLVPVLTPGTTNSTTETTETTLRAVMLESGLGAFGAANGPTVPLPGRQSRWAAFTIAPSVEEQPTAD